LQSTKKVIVPATDRIKYRRRTDVACVKNLVTKTKSDGTCFAVGVGGDRRFAAGFAVVSRSQTRVRRRTTSAASVASAASAAGAARAASAASAGAASGGKVGRIG
jgi:hypothetical protein